jgi:hypothetical protein
MYDPRVQNTIHTWDGFAHDRYLLGYDRKLDEDFSHRVDWAYGTLSVLSRYFAIEVHAVAEMENHFHHVLTNRPDIPKTWKPAEVARRWLVITKMKITGSMLDIQPSEERVAQEVYRGQRRIAKLRKRLADPSWFMGALKEILSRKMNRESHLDGTNYQMRFQCRVSQGDEQSQTMVKYVDLNPVRAGIVDKMEDSERSSVGLRIRAALALRNGCPYPPTDYRSVEWLTRIAKMDNPQRPLDDPLYMTSVTGMRVSDRSLLPCDEWTYYERLDQLARVRRPDKRGYTPAHLPPVLVRIGFRPPDLDTP